MAERVIRKPLGVVWTLRNGEKIRTLRAVAHPHGIDLICEHNGQLFWSRVFKVPSELVAFATEQKAELVGKG
jgi:hypothetical protein